MRNHGLKYGQINLKDYILIDIREEEDYKNFHITDAIHLQDIAKIGHIAKENPDKKILLYCYHGNTANSYTQELVRWGFENIYFLQENYEEFESLGIPLSFQK